jgi:hypothetical protein
MFGMLGAFALGCSGTPEDLAGKAVSQGTSKGSGGSGGSGAATGAGRGGSSSSRAGASSNQGGASSSGATGGTLGVMGGGAGRLGKGGAGGALGVAGLGGKGMGGSSSSAGAAGGSGDDAGGGPTVGGCSMFPADDAWNQDISGAKADATWTTHLQNMVKGTKLHPDYGNDGSTLYGIPVGVVPKDQPALPVVFDWYADESDPGPYPFPSPAAAKIEGGDAMNCDGDCHLLVVQQGTCQLYEGYACHYDGGWHCGNGAHWDLTKDGYGQRPKGWTSADAAGLAIAPGILRYDEVRAGEVKHAIRFTTACTRANFVAPATHEAVPSDCDPQDPDSPPMGLRVRLKADYDISALPKSAQVVLTAMKRYGMILADNGSNFYFQGEANAGWTDDDIEPLKTVPASAFEAVAVPSLEH